MYCFTGDSVHTFRYIVYIFVLNELFFYWAVTSVVKLWIVLNGKWEIVMHGRKEVSGESRKLTIVEIVVVFLYLQNNKKNMQIKFKVQYLIKLEDKYITSCQIQTLYVNTSPRYWGVYKTYVKCVKGTLSII